MALVHDAVHRKRGGVVAVVDNVGARKRRAVLVLEMVVGKVAAGVRVSKAELVRYGNGGLCLGCKPCRYPVCPFGK